METKKYSTSKSKTFDKETDVRTIFAWVFCNIPDDKFKTDKKYKITIVNLNE